MNLCRKLGLALRHPLRKCGLHTDGHGLLHKWINQPCSLIFYTSGSFTQVDFLYKWINYQCGLIFYTSEYFTQEDFLHKWINHLCSLIFYTSESSA